MARIHGTSISGVPLTNPLQFKGAINIASDFPILADVQTGWFYTIGTNVTDNDVTKTNTGQSFLAADEIAWNGTNWTLLGNLSTSWLTTTSQTGLTGNKSGTFNLIGGNDGSHTFRFGVSTDNYAGYLSSGGGYVSIVDSATGVFITATNGSYLFEGINGAYGGKFTSLVGGSTDVVTLLDGTYAINVIGNIKSTGTNLRLNQTDHVGWFYFNPYTVWICDGDAGRALSADDGTRFVQFADGTYAINVVAGNSYFAGTLEAGVSTFAGNNSNAAFTLLNLNNNFTPLTTQTAQTSDLVFNLTQSINSVASLHEAAKISAYKVSDWFHASAETDTDSGLKFWTTNSGTPTLQLTINEVGLATFVGNITTSGTLEAAHTTIDSTLLLQSGSITDSSGAISFDNENLTTTGTGTFGTAARVIIGAATYAVNIDNGGLRMNSSFIYLGSTVSDPYIYNSSGTVYFINTTGVSISGTLAAAHTTIDATMLLQSGSITDSTGAISFDNENIITSGTLGAGATTLTGNLTVGSTTAGYNETINATLTTDIAPSFAAANWTGTNGWTADGAGTQLTKVTNVAAGTIQPSGTGATPTAGVTYKLVIVCSAKGSPSVSYLYGGSGGVITVGTITQYVTATNTTKLIITGAISSTCTITSITIEPLTNNTGDLTVDGNLNVRSPVGLGTPAVIGTPLLIQTQAGFGGGIRINQGADNTGFILYGYDDESNANFFIGHNGSGACSFVSTHAFSMQSTLSYFALTSANSFYLTLGDAAGANAIYIRDSGYVVVASIDSDGNAIFNGTGLIKGNTTIGSGAAGIDYTLTFDGETNNGIITWMEDEDYFKFSDTVDIEADLFFIGAGTGLPYGGFYTNADIVTTLTLQSTAYEIDGATAWTTGLLNLCTFTDPYIVVTKAGTYKITWSCSVSLDTANQEVEFGILLNQTTVQNAGQSHAKFLVAGDKKEITGTAILTLAANDKISLWANNNTSAGKVVTVSHGNLNVFMIGG